MIDKKCKAQNHAVLSTLLHFPEMCFLAGIREGIGISF
jgi:hypothetical protein